MQLIVLGMHRSGTSVLGRLLNMMGAYFGPEGVSTGANKENAKGFWERRDIRFLNDALLHAAGCDWHRVLRFDVSAIPDKTLTNLRALASKIVLEMDAHRPWFIKDPRLCVLLPFWRSVLEMPVCIHVVRHPDEVAASLGKRNGIPLEVGVALWEAYVRSALEASRDLPNAWVSHAELMADPAGAVRGLLDRLQELGVSGLRMPSGREIELFVDRKLYRERRPTDASTKSAHAMLFDGIGRGDALPAWTTESKGVLGKFEDGLPPPKPIDPALPASIAEGSLGVRMSYLEQEVRTFLRTLGELEETVKMTLQEGAASMAARTRQLEEDLENCRSQVLTAEAMTAALRQGLDESLSQLGSVRAELEAETSRRREEALASQAKIASLESSAESLEGRLNAATVERDQAAAEVGRLRSENQQLREECSRHIADDQAIRAQLDEARASASGLRDELARVSGELATSRAGCEALRGEAQRLAQELLAMEESVSARFSEIETVTTMLVDAENRFAHEKALHDATRQAGIDLVDDYGLRIAVLAERLAELEHVASAVLTSRSWRFSALVRRGGGISDAHVPSAADAAILARSSLFDPAWYLETYPDVAAVGMEPVEHFLRFGAAEQRNPGPNFDTAAYVSAHPESVRSGLNPLIHHLVHEARGAL